MPKYSIVTPCYNAQDYIERTILSVRAQTNRDWEHVVLDDGSLDGSADVVRRCMAEDGRVRLVQQKNAGLAKARNAGFRACSEESRYVVFLDADDCLEPDALEKAGQYLDAHSHVGMVHCNHSYIDENDRPLSSHDVDIVWRPRLVPSGLGIRSLRDDEAQTPFISLLAIPGILPSLCVFRRSIFLDTHGWDEELGIVYEDVSLYLEMALRSDVHYLPIDFLRYRIRPGQSHVSDRDKYEKQLQRLYAKWRAVHNHPQIYRDTISQAWRVFDGRLQPISGFGAGVRHLKQGNVNLGLRFCLGAVRRYASSFVPSKV